MNNIFFEDWYQLLLQGVSILLGSATIILALSFIYKGFKKDK